MLRKLLNGCLTVSGRSGQGAGAVVTSAKCLGRCVFPALPAPQRFLVFFAPPDEFGSRSRCYRGAPWSHSLTQAGSTELPRTSPRFTPKG